MPRSASNFSQAEYDGPTVKTAIPGPKSKELLKELNALQVSASSYVYNLNKFIKEIVYIFYRSAVCKYECTQFVA